MARFPTAFFKAAGLPGGLPEGKTLVGLYFSF